MGGHVCEVLKASVQQYCGYGTALIYAFVFIYRIKFVYIMIYLNLKVNYGTSTWRSLHITHEWNIVSLENHEIKIFLLTMQFDCTNFVRKSFCKI